jgi:WD40 repeat protein/HEAT repeat protein
VWFRFVLLGFLTAVLLLAAGSSEVQSAGPGGDKERSRLDTSGDVLPTPAVLRLGSLRFRGSDRIAAAAVFPDGKTVATLAMPGSEDALQLWDLTTGRRSRWGMKHLGRLGVVSALVTSPAGGEKFGVVRLKEGIDVFALAPDRDLEPSPRPGCAWTAYSPDCTTLAGLEAQRVVLWDIRRREVRLELKHPPNAVGNAVAFSPDGATLAVGYGRILGGAVPGDTAIRLWDAKTGKLLDTFEGHTNAVLTLAFSPDGKSFASVSRDGTIRVWDLRNKRERHRIAAEAVKVGYSPNGKLLASWGWWSNPASVKLWDAERGVLVRDFGDCGSRVESLAFSPDGNKFITAGESRALQVWDVGGKEALPFPGHLDIVYAVAFSPDGKTLATRSADQTLRLWDAATGAERRRLRFADGFEFDPSSRVQFYPARSLSYTRNGKYLAAFGAVPAKSPGLTYPLHVWDAASGEMCATLEPLPIGHQTVAAAPDDDTLALPVKGGLRLWSLSARRDTRFLASERDGGDGRSTYEDWAPAFSPDGRTLATCGSRGKIIRLWDWKKGTILRTLVPPNLVWAVRFSPDGKILACEQGFVGGERAPTVAFLEVATGTPIRTIKAHRGGVNAVAFSPEGRIAATAGYLQKEVRLWNLPTGEQIAVLKGHDGGVCCVAFSPDGKRLASASTDCTALVWDVAGIAAKLPSADATADALASWWTALAEPKAEKAYSALWSLAGAGDKAVRFLASRIATAPDLSKRMAELLTALESNDFPTREAAAKELVRLGQAVVPALGKTLDDQPSAEMRKRLQSLLEEIGTGPPPAEALRQTRAVQVLEQIASPQACELLKKLATGAAEAELTRDARAALRRLERRPIEPAPARLSGACLGDDPKQAPKAPDLPPFHKLGLSDEQLKDLARVRAKYAAKVKEVEEKIRGLRDEEAAELENVLTDAQRARLKELRAAGSPPDKGNPDFQGDKLVKLLDADFEELLAKERDPAALREAARLFESSKKPSAWTDYSKALAILRRTRAKAGIPLLLRCMVDHASVTGHNEQVKIPRYAETFIILTGKEIDSPYKSVANPAKAAQDAVAEVVRTWWLPNKAKLTTELGRMSLEQRQAVARVLLREGERDLALSGPGGGTEQAARRISHILQLQLERSELPGPPRIWQPEDLHPTMLPFLLAEAGWEADPPDKQLRGDIYRIPFAAIPLLASLRKNGNLPDLHRIAADRRQTSATRLTCLLALAGAGEALETKPLLGILDGETKQERRLAAVLALEHCRDANAAVPQLVKLLEDPDRQVRYAAVLALRGPKPKEAVPALKKLLDELPSKDRNLSYVLRLLGDIGGKDAQAILADFLRKKLADRGRTAALGLALHAFEKATGKRWTESGSPTDAILRKQVKQALEWWDKQKEEREK